MKQEAINIIHHAMNRNFSDFKNEVNNYLKSKIANSPAIQSVNSAEEKLENIQNQFRRIQEK